MNATVPILRAGLTGGIASGKTTVGKIFTEHGALVVDADVLAREALEPAGSAFARVVARFGRDLLDGRGEIRREVLAQRIFGDPAERHALEAIVHPEVRAAFDQRVLDWAAAGHGPIAMLDAALLVESGGYRALQKLVVVRCSPEVQLARLLARGFAMDDARRRIEAQAPLEVKLAVADYVIETDGTLRETRAQTDDVWRSLIDEHRRAFGVG